MISSLSRPRDLAKRFGKSEQWVRDLWRSGQIEAVVVQAKPSRPKADGSPGNERFSLMFTEEQIQDFIRHHSRKGKPE